MTHHTTQVRYICQLPQYTIKQKGLIDHVYFQKKWNRNTSNKIIVKIHSSFCHDFLFTYIKAKDQLYRINHIRFNIV